MIQSSRPPQMCQFIAVFSTLPALADRSRGTLQLFACRDAANNFAPSEDAMKLFRRILTLLVLATIATSARAQDRSQTRSMVLSRGGIVAAESPLAAQAGVKI